VKKGQLADTPATEQSAVEQFFVCLLPVQTATNTWRLHNLIYTTVHFNYSTFNHDSGQTVAGQISYRQELNQSVLLDLDFFQTELNLLNFCLSTPTIPIIHNFTQMIKIMQWQN